MTKLTKKEQDWFVRLQKCLDAAPKTLDKKVSSFTIGDKNITVFDPAKVKACENDRTLEFTAWGGMDTGCQVENADAEILVLYFPFHIESTAG